MMDFVHPAAWLLLVPIAVAYRHWVWPGRPLVTALRALFSIAVVGLLAEPFSRSGVAGRDLVLLVDRSRSVPQSAARRVQEIAELAASHARAGDRLALVSFGRQAEIDVPPTQDFRGVASVSVQQDLDRDATDFSRAIERGLALIPPGRPGSLLLISDGENTGVEAAPSARAALRRGVRIDAVSLRRRGVSDLAVEEVGVPGEVGVGEPFQFSAWIRTDRALEAPVRLLRDGVVIAEGDTQFRSGLNRVVFRDRLVEQGIHRYEVEVRVDGDRVPENDRAQAVLRVVGPSRVLCVTPNGRTDRLVTALRSSGIEVVVSRPETAPLSLGQLDGFRSVVLENVPAGDLPNGSLAALASYVRSGGGGLMLTGGAASFGVGGYHRTEVEEVLPVTMEVRQEQRRFALAMAIVLDRSGSMGAPAGPGQTKMDLANLGTIAAAELLGPMDELTVIAVDSSPHVMLPLTEVVDRQSIIESVRQIRAGGGGIYVYRGLLAAVAELEHAKAANKHIVLFADAADAEEPGAYNMLLPKLVKAGVTVSVIGLGEDTNSDAALLEDIAVLGGSVCTFVADATDLPRVFAQQTIAVVRSSFVEQSTAVDVLPDLLAVGELAFDVVPAVGGYSVAYLEAGASVGMQTADDVRAPLFSFWQHGLGRTAAFLGEIDGDATGAFAEWRGLTDFLATTVRWIGGSDARGRVFADLRRRGHRAVLSVEVDASAEAELGQLQAIVSGPGGDARVFLRRSSATRLEASLPLEGDGVYRAAVRLSDGSVVRVPPVTLPYSPEFEPRADSEVGVRTLSRLCSITGGRLDGPVESWFRGPRTGAGVRDLGWLFATLALSVLLVEIAVRRLDLRPRFARATAKGPLVAAPQTEEPGRSTPSSPTSPELPSTPPQDPPPPSAESAPDGIAAVLDRARAKGRRRR